MIPTLLVIAAIVYVSFKPISDVTTKRPVDFYLDWYHKYPKYRSVETIHKRTGKPVFDAQLRHRFWPFWIALDQSNYQDSLEDSKKRIASEKTFRSRKIVHQVP